MGLDNSVLSQVKALKASQHAGVPVRAGTEVRGVGKPMQPPRVDLARDPISSQNTYYKCVHQELLRTCLGSTEQLLTSLPVVTSL